MYYYLKGTVVETFDNYVVIDVGGIGYQVLVMHTEDFPIGSEVLIYIVHVVREDEEYFVGFKNLREKDIFSKLINVKGIGPKTAITALRGITVEEFVIAIQNEDLKRLKKLEGIGPKAASQIVLDMKGVLTEVDTSRTAKSSYTQAQEDAIAGLKTLGFKDKDIKEKMDKINDATLTTQDYITQILRMMNTGK